MVEQNPAEQPGDGDLIDGVLVSADFPRDPFPSTLPGSQPKFLAWQIDGCYVVGLTEDERKERFLACRDLVAQVTAYTLKKHPRRPSLITAALLQEIDIAIRRKGWDWAASSWTGSSQGFARIFFELSI